MRLSLFVKTVIFTCLAFVFAYIFYLYSGESFKTNFSNGWLHLKGNYQTFNEQVSLKDINTLNIEVLNADVYVQNSSQAEGKVQFTSPQSQAGTFTSALNGNTLFIKVNDADNHYHFDNSLEISVPDNVKNITIKDKAGNIKIQNLNLNTLDINADAGNIKARNVTINDVTVNTMSGNVKAKGLIKNMVAKLVNGNISVDSTYNQPNYRLDTVSGNIQVKLPKIIQSSLDISSNQGIVSNRGLITENNSQSSVKVHSQNGNVLVEGQ